MIAIMQIANMILMLFFTLMKQGLYQAKLTLFNIE